MHDPMLMKTLMRDDVVQLRSLLLTSFVWMWTEQGHEYWVDVHTKLEGILDFADEQLKANQEQEDANS